MDRHDDGRNNLLAQIFRTINDENNPRVGKTRVDKEA